MRTAVPWNHFSRNSLLPSILAPEVSFVCALRSTQMKHESGSLKCLWCKLCSTFTTFGAYLLQVSTVPSEKSNPTRTGNVLAETQAEKGPPKLLGETQQYHRQPCLYNTSFGGSLLAVNHELWLSTTTSGILRFQRRLNQGAAYLVRLSWLSLPGSQISWFCACVFKALWHRCF